MNIAVVTDDQITICPHFGRATHYLVFTVEGGHILNEEIRPKAGHHTRSHQHDRGDHAHRPGEHHSGADLTHRRMVAAIEDCQVVIVGGMGQGARKEFEAAGITTCATDIRDAREAVRAYLEGAHMPQPDCSSNAAQSH
ncbi:MAG: NifB/NifX family molybdenum-iron cluster-binding protein [Alkalispirochaeta sp.]